MLYWLVFAGISGKSKALHGKNRSESTDFLVTCRPYCFHIYLIFMIRELYYKYKQRRYGWFGNYSSWKQVCDEADGYDSDIIFEKTKQAILKVKSGEAVYERDSVIFDRKEYNFAIIAFLQYSAIIKK